MVLQDVWLGPLEPCVTVCEDEIKDFTDQEIATLSRHLNKIQDDIVANYEVTTVTAKHYIGRGCEPGVTQRVVDLIVSLCLIRSDYLVVSELLPGGEWWIHFTATFPVEVGA
jgi:hypothetical protein